MDGFTRWYIFPSEDDSLRGLSGSSHTSKKCRITISMVIIKVLEKFRKQAVEELLRFIGVPSLVEQKSLRINSCKPSPGLSQKAVHANLSKPVYAFRQSKAAFTQFDTEGVIL